MAHHKLTTSTLIATGTMVLALSLTGCGSNPIDDLANKAGDAAAEQGAEKAIEGMSGGGVDVEFGSLPEGFPDAIPLVEGDILSASKVAVDDENGDGYTVALAVNDDPASVAEQVQADFADWDEGIPWNDNMNSGLYSNDDWGVTVLVLEGDSDRTSTVGYTVGPQTE